MATESIEVAAVIPADPYRIYQAWLNGLQHGAMTGGTASIEPWPGGRFHAWNGYIHGTNLDLDPSRRILQSWRTSDFPNDAPDSRAEITLEPVEGGTRVTIVHTDIPAGQGATYRQGWIDYYLRPMRAYFSAETPRAGAAAAQATVRAPRRRSPTRRPTRSRARTGRTGGAKKRPAARGGAKKRPAKRAAAKKKPAKKTAAKKKAKKKAAKKRPAKKKAAKRKAAKKKTAKRRPAKKKAAKKRPAKKKAAKKKAAKKKAAKRKAAKKKSAKRRPAKKAGKKKPAKKKPARKRRR